MFSSLSVLATELTSAAARQADMSNSTTTFLPVTGSCVHHNNTLLSAKLNGEISTIPFKQASHPAFRPSLCLALCFLPRWN